MKTAVQRFTPRRKDQVHRPAADCVCIAYSPRRVSSCYRISLNDDVLTPSRRVFARILTYNLNEPALPSRGRQLPQRYRHRFFSVFLDSSCFVSGLRSFSIRRFQTYRISVRWLRAGSHCVGQILRLRRFSALIVSRYSGMLTETSLVSPSDVKTARQSGTRCCQAPYTLLEESHPGS